MMQPATDSVKLFQYLGASMVHSVFVQTGAIPPIKRFDRPIAASSFDPHTGKLIFGSGLKWMVKALDRNVHLYVTIEPTGLYSVWAMTTTKEYNDGAPFPVYRLLQSVQGVNWADLQGSVMGMLAKAIRNI